MSNVIRFSSFLVLVTILYLSAGTEGVLFFEHANFQGRFFRAPGGWADWQKCNNIDSWMNDRISSINTEGHCIIVYEHGGCRGRSARLFPGSCCHGSTADLGLHDSITSYRGC